MAIKGTKNDTTTAAATAPANVAPDSGVPTPAPVKEKRKRGPIGPSIWSTERSAALAATLKNPAAAMVKTAGSVAAVLSQLPEFAGVELTPAKIALKVNSVIKQRKAAGLPLPTWLKLDRSRTSAADLGLFGDDESTGESEDGEEGAE